MAGTIEKRGEKSWRLTVTAGYAGKKQNRYRKTVIAENQNAAEKLLAAFVVEVERGQITTSGKMTLKEFFAYWEINYALDRHAPKTILGNRELFNNRIAPALGHKRLDRITPKNLLDFYQNLKEQIKAVRKKKTDPANPVPVQQPQPEPTEALESADPKSKSKPKYLSPNTIRKYHVLLHTLLGKAVQWQLIAYNPAEKVEPPKTIRSQIQIYDEETTGRFLLCLEKEKMHHRVMALLSISTGLRRGEMFGLQWKHFDAERCMIQIEQASQYLPGEGIFQKDPKNETSKRLITIPDTVAALLQEYKVKQLARRLKLGGTVENGGKWAGADDPEDDFIFITWNGKPAHPDSINTWLKRFIEANSLPHITPHSFRHMAATYLITSGTDLRTVAGKLGHANSTTTQVVYSHLLKSAEKETAEKMESILQGITDKAKEKQKKEQQKKQAQYELHPNC